MTVDWRKILVAYMAHVIDAEGIDFLTTGLPPYKTAVSRLSEDELAALMQALADARFAQ